MAHGFTYEIKLTVAQSATHSSHSLMRENRSFGRLSGLMALTVFLRSALAASSLSYSGIHH
jgi:hypothetical protein